MWTILDYQFLSEGFVAVTAKSGRVWTVADAKARLSEILRLAEEEGPQRIGTRKAFVVVPAHVWEARTPEREPLGRWLVENVPRGSNLEVPARRDSGRAVPSWEGNPE